MSKAVSSLPPRPGLPRQGIVGVTEHPPSRPISAGVQHGPGCPLATRGGALTHTNGARYAGLEPANKSRLSSISPRPVLSTLRNGEDRRELLVRSGTDETQGVLISVQDSGPGLDPKSLDHLFDAFYTTKPQGLGMGLAISRSIIEAHGGRLWATANVPHGAVFQFTIPIDSERMA